MALAPVLAACASDKPADDGRTDVVAPFFALAEAARGVGGHNVRVHDLTPPGVEPHDLELSPNQVDLVQDADVVIVLPGFQPALDRAAKQAKGKVVRLDQFARQTPHVWLSLTHFPDVVGLIAADIPGANAAPFRDELRFLDGQFEHGTRLCERRTLITAHDAFHAWKHYGLDPHAISTSPEAEPAPSRIAELADLVRRTGTTTVFGERLAGTETAEGVAREAGVRVDVLDTLESGEPGTYFRVMRENLDKVRAALGCQ